MEELNAAPLVYAVSFSLGKQAGTRFQLSPALPAGCLCAVYKLHKFMWPL